MAIDLPPKAALWVPPKPALIRSVSADDAALVRAARRSGAAQRRGTFPMPMFCPSRAPISVAYTDDVASSSWLSTNTWSNVNIGTAFAGRRVLAAWYYEYGDSYRELATVTINGVSATRLFIANGTSSEQARLELWIATVPTGALVNVTYTTTTNTLRPHFQLFAVTNLTSNTALGSATQIIDSLSSDPSVNVTASSGDLIFGMLGVATSTATIAWPVLSGLADTPGNDGSRLSSAFMIASSTGSQAVAATTGVTSDKALGAVVLR